MSTDTNFGKELQSIQLEKAEINKNIQHINKVLNANNYKLRLVQEKEISLYKKHGQKVPKELTHPELVKIQKTAIVGKEVLIGKYDELYGLIQDRGIDREMLSNKFDDYVALCKEKGTQIKSSEELAKVISSIKNFKEEIKEVSLYDIMNKVSQEAETKTEAIRKSLKSYDFSSKIDFIVNRFFPAKAEGYTEEKEKYVLLFRWAQTVEEKLNDSHIELYNSYLSYVQTVKSDATDSLIFKHKNGDFTRAIEKYQSIQSETSVDKEYESQLGI